MQKHLSGRWSGCGIIWQNRIGDKMRKPKIDEKKILSTHQQWYWKDPEHARELQRAKYTRYPDKIKAMNKSWQERNPERWKILTNFGSRIHYWRVIKHDPVKVQLLETAKKEALRKLDDYLMCKMR